MVKNSFYTPSTEGLCRVLIKGLIGCVLGELTKAQVIWTAAGNIQVQAVAPVPEDLQESRKAQVPGILAVSLLTNAMIPYT